MPRELKTLNGNNIIQPWTHMTHILKKKMRVIFSVDPRLQHYQPHWIRYNLSIKENKKK